MQSIHKVFYALPLQKALMNVVCFAVDGGIVFYNHILF